MARQNLRILYNNVADSATITTNGTATGYPADNLKSDIKGLVWRSTSKSATTITLTWDSAQDISCVVLPYTNLSAAATFRVVCKNASGTSVYDSGTLTALAYSLDASAGVSYQYNSGACVRLYLPSTVSLVRSMDITISDASSSYSYMEVSRVLTGKYWSPQHNLEFGVSVTYNDSSTHSRMNSGDLITDIGYVYRSLNFNLGYLTDLDRDEIINIVRRNSMRKAMWISLFPMDEDPEKEYIYSIYGKLSQSATITHPMYTQYVSSITIEEV